MLFECLCQPISEIFPVNQEAVEPIDEEWGTNEEKADSEEDSEPDFAFDE